MGLVHTEITLNNAWDTANAGRQGLEGFRRGTEQRGVERPERVSAEPRKARSAEPDAPKLAKR
jgi:hypothetical protein